MDSFTLDAARSSLFVRTRAVGLLARFAHDLALRVERVDGTATESATPTVELRVHAVGVVGVVRKDGVTDANALSPSDVKTIVQRANDLFFPSGPLTVRGEGAGPRVQVQVVAAKGTHRTSCDVVRRTDGAQGHHVSGRCPVSLKALGIPPIEGPLGSFRLADEIEVRFELLFVRA